MAIIPWIFEGVQIFGFDITGWSWVIQRHWRAMVCLLNHRQDFPFLLFSGCRGSVSFLLYWFFGRENPDPTEFPEMLSTLAVGCAASIFRPDRLQLENVVRWITRLGWIVWDSTACPHAHDHYRHTAWSWLYGRRNDRAPAFGRLLRLVLTPAVTTPLSVLLLIHAGDYIYLSNPRPIVAMFSCLPLTVAPLALRRRILFCGGDNHLFTDYFNTERMQERMFWSGEASWRMWVGIIQIFSNKRSLHL